MRAVCDTCGARYRIPEEKLEGKILRIRCRKCENVFTVKDSSGSDAVAARQASAGEWFFAIGGESFGPYTQEELLDRFESGRLGVETYIWKQGFSEWMPVTEHPTFAAGIELAKNSMRRFGSQRPNPVQNSEGSGRYTVELRRPGATLGEEYKERSSVIESEVDDAFDSLIGSVQSHRSPSDQDTATEPMRNLAAASLLQETPEPEEPAPAATTITSKAVSTSAKPSRPSGVTRPVTGATPVVRASSTESDDNGGLRATAARVPSSAGSERPTRTVRPITRSTPTIGKTQEDASQDDDVTEAPSPTPVVSAQRPAASTADAASPGRPRTTATAARSALPPASNGPRKPATSAAGLSLSERLRQIREKGPDGPSASTAPQPARPTGALPTPTTRTTGALPTRSGLPTPTRPVTGRLQRVETSTPVTGESAIPSARVAEPVTPADDAPSHGLDSLDSLFREGFGSEETHVGKQGFGASVPGSPLAEERTVSVSVPQVATQAQADADPFFSEEDDLFGGGDTLFGIPPQNASSDSSAHVSEEDRETEDILNALQPLRADIPVTIQETPPVKKLAPLPVGPIRQVTQELDISDLFAEDDEATQGVETTQRASSTHAAPSTEELQEFIDRRKKERTGNFPSATGSHPLREAQSTPVAGTAAVPLATPAPSTPVAAPAPRTESIALDEVQALQHERARQRRWMQGLLAMLLLLCVVVLTLTLLLPKRSAEDAEATPEVVAEVVPVPAVRPADFERARNRAASVVAQAQAKAASAAFVATEGERQQQFANSQRSQRPERAERAERSRDTPANTQGAEMGFRLDGAARPDATSVRRSENTGPTSAHFASTLQGAVRTSVGRCAQRARAMDGGLSVARLELSITIRPDGTVERVNAQRNARDSTLMNCMRNESMRWRFASFEGSNTTITHPYVLQ